MNLTPFTETYYFHVPIGYLYVFFGKIFVQFLCLIFKSDCLRAFCYLVVRVLYIIWILIPYPIYDL